VDWPNEVIRLAVHKTKRQTGRDRVIVLSPASLAVLQAAGDARGRLLFRNQFGRAFTRYAVGKRLKRVSDRLGFRVVAYGCRHSFATEKLLKGVPEVVVAAALGQKGTGMLTKHYSHVNEDARAIREAMDRADRRAG
jgi:integrase